MSVGEAAGKRTLTHLLLGVQTHTRFWQISTKASTKKEIRRNSVFPQKDPCSGWRFSGKQPSAILKRL